MSKSQVNESGSMSVTWWEQGVVKDGKRKQKWGENYSRPSGKRASSWE